VDRFAESQSHRVDGPEEDRHSLGGAGVDDLMNLAHGDDFGERLGPLDFELIERVPIATMGDPKEELEGGQRNGERTFGILFLVLEKQEVTSKLLFRDPIRRTLTMFGKFSDLTKVPIMGPLPFAS